MLGLRLAVVSASQHKSGFCTNYIFDNEAVLVTDVVRFLFSVVFKHSDSALYQLSPIITGYKSFWLTQYNTIQYSAVQYSTIQYEYDTTQYCIPFIF